MLWVLNLVPTWRGQLKYKSWAAGDDVVHVILSSNFVTSRYYPASLLTWFIECTADKNPQERKLRTVLSLMFSLTWTGENGKMKMEKFLLSLCSAHRTDEVLANLLTVCWGKTMPRHCSRSQRLLSAKSSSSTALHHTLYRFMICAVYLVSK